MTNETNNPLVASGKPLFFRAAAGSGLHLAAIVWVALYYCVAQAHHSIAGVYDEKRAVNVEGTVARFDFVNPHPMLIIDVESGDDAPIRWQAEMDNRFELADIGVTADTFKLGDRVVARGSPHRTEPHRLYLRRLDRAADGFRYEQVGFRPRTSVVRPE